MNNYDREVLRVVKESFKLKPEIWTYDASGNRLVSKDLGLHITINRDESYMSYIKIDTLRHNLSYSLFMNSTFFGSFIPWRRRVVSHFSKSKKCSPELELFIHNITSSWDKIRRKIYETDTLYSKNRY